MRSARAVDTTQGLCCGVLQHREPILKSDFNFGCEPAAFNKGIELIVLTCDLCWKSVVICWGVYSWICPGPISSRKDTGRARAAALLCLGSVGTV